MKRLVIIDGKSVFYRGYYAMPELSLPDGTPTGGVYGFAMLSLEIIHKLKPDYVVVAWDKKGTSIRKRLEILPSYKAGRKTAPDDFYIQIPILHELLGAFSWPLYELDDYEADDIMGALSQQASQQDIESCLITSDLDMLQLISPLTHVYAMKKGLANIEKFDIEYFEQKYGISTNQFLDLKSLKGDSSDNIPGVPGVGEKTAIQLLQKYKSLDGIYNNIDDIKLSLRTKLINGKESAYVSKRVGEIWCDAPVELDLNSSDVNNMNTIELNKILKKLEFKSLLKKLPEYMKQSSDEYISNATVIKPLIYAEWPDTIIFDSTKEVILHLSPNGNQIWISTDGISFSGLDIKKVDISIWRALEMIKVVVYDAKYIYHMLHSKGISLRFDEIHDIRQAAFLINSLDRDRSINGLLDNQIDLDEPTQVIAALLNIYNKQKIAFLDQPRVAKIAKDLDFPLTYVLYRMEQKGIKIDTKILKAMSVELATELSDLEKSMHEMAGREFNIASPTQLSEVLFIDLALPVQGIKKGKKGYSTGQKELDKLRGQHPIIELIEKTREIAKLKNTYIDTLPLQVKKDDRIHTTFNQDAASTGRLSSVNPNLQNIPIRSDLGRRIRKAFIAEPGNVLVSADYSQFELRLAAILAGDDNLIDDFNTSIDIHTKTASEVYGIDIKNVSSVQRRDAKIINFGILYGMSPHGLSAATDMNFTQAKSFIDHYFSIREPIRDYIDRTINDASKNGYVETYYGRRRPTPDISSSNYIVRESAKRAAANMPIQGTEADLMKKAMLAVDKELGELGDQILQVHDSILIECSEDNSSRVANILTDIMENIAPELKIRLKVDVKIAKNWSDL